MPCTILPYNNEVQPVETVPEDGTAHVSGSDEAAVSLVLFTDFQCPGCAVLAASLEQVRAAHAEDVRLIVRYLPDARFDKSSLAIQAAEAASLQGKFWEMYRLLFEKQPEWYGLSPEDFPAWAVEQAEDLGMDAVQFEADLNGDEVSLRVGQALEAGKNIPYSPPLLFINSNTYYTGLADPASLDVMVRLALLETRKFHACPDWRLDATRQYIVTLQTERGDIVLQLYPDKAPLAVNNFIFLAESGWYNLIPFHRVEAGFVAQSGDPSGTGFGNPGYYFATEAAPGALFNRAGLLAMSNVGMDTNGSQFFITYASTPKLNGQFTIFGEVLSGMEVLESLTAGDLLLQVSVEER